MSCPKFVFMCLHEHKHISMCVYACVCLQENHSGCLLLPAGIGLIPIQALEFLFRLCL